MSTDPREVSATLRQLHLLVDDILFGEHQWPGDPGVLRCRFALMGLTHSDDCSAFRNTALGDTVEADLFLAFLGGWDEAEIPSLLERFQLMSRSEAETVWDQLEAGQDPWPWLRARLQRAYRDHFGQLSTN